MLWTIHVAAAEEDFLVDNNPNVGHAAAQVPSNQVAGRVILSAVGDGQDVSLALEKRYQIGHAPRVDVGIRMFQPLD